MSLPILGPCTGSGVGSKCAIAYINQSGCSSGGCATGCADPTNIRAWLEGAALTYLNGQPYETTYDGCFNSASDASPASTGSDPTVGGCYSGNCGTSSIACLGGGTGGSIIQFAVNAADGNLYVLGLWNDPSNNYTTQRSCLLSTGSCAPCGGLSYTLPVPPVDLYNQVSEDGARTHYAAYFMAADNPGATTTISAFEIWSNFLSDCPTDSNVNPAACVTLPSPCAASGDPFFGDDPP